MIGRYVKSSISSFGNIINKVYTKTTLFIFCVLSIYLLILSGFSTSAINLDEQTYLIKDSIITNLLFAILFFEVLVLLNNPLTRIINHAEITFRKCKLLILLLFTVFLLIYIISARKLQNYDSKFIFDVAEEWREGIYTSMMPGGYAEAHPTNKGIIMLIYLFSFLFGTHNYLVFQIINVLFLSLLYNAIVELAKSQGATNTSALTLLIICTMFIPLNMYSIYTYGVIIGISCMMNSLLFLIKYLDTGKTWYSILSILFCFVGIVVKQNGSIFLIGMIIMLIVRLFRLSDKKRTIPVLLSLIGILFFTTPLIKHTTDMITNTKTGNGISINAYIAMGFNEDSYLYPGWYNTYVDASYTEARMSTERQRKAANKVILNKLNEFRRNPIKGIDFFSRKNASQWNNPDFEAIWLLQFRASSNDNYPRILTYLESTRGAALFNRITNRIHFIVLFGVMLFAFLKTQKTDLDLYYCIVIIGGFFFHTFWEAKCQYILPYFTLMLPLSASGYSELLNILKDYRVVLKRFRILIPLLIILIISIFINLKISVTLNKIFARHEDTMKYIEYIEHPLKY